jgi:predicted RNase H-like nuclease (RuvC/YqgF family)
VQGIKRTKNGRVHFVADALPGGVVTRWTENVSDAAGLAPVVASRVIEQYQNNPKAGEYEVIDIEYPRLVITTPDESITVNIQQLASDNARLKREIADLESRLEAAAKEAKNLRELVGKSGNASALQTEVNSLKTRLNAATAENKRLQDQLAKNQATSPASSSGGGDKK